MSLAAQERRKYHEVWRYSQYRHHSPGEWSLPLFRQIRRKRGTLIDLGCGTGRAGFQLSKEGWDVTLLDFVDNCLDYEPAGSGLPFIKSNLWTPWKGHFDVGYCCDVMEHIPPSKVDRVLKNIFKSCDCVFFQIHNGPDNFGAVVGHPLHLTVEPFVWWKEKLSNYGKLVEARDLAGLSVFYVKGR